MTKPNSHGAKHASAAPTGEAQVDPSATPPPALWQDIASAPRDGTAILVSLTHSLPDGEWENIQWVDWARGDDVVWPVFQRDISIPFPPSHWMPLPTPPVTP